MEKSTRQIWLAGEPGGITHTAAWPKQHVKSPFQVSKQVPDLITGDFDSADMSHVEHFRGLGATVAITPDQDHTDFTKALIELHERHVDGADGLEAVVAFIEAGGRVDHIMGNFQVNWRTKIVPVVNNGFL